MISFWQVVRCQNEIIEGFLHPLKMRSGFPVVHDNVWTHVVGV